MGAGQLFGAVRHILLENDHDLGGPALHTLECGPNAMGFGT